jgi:uncharacterized RDD family membrane protein YckC
VTSNGPRRRGVFELLSQPVNAVADAVVPTVVDAVDVNSVVERVDINAIVDRVDINAIVDRVDIDEVLKGVDINAVLARIDLDAVVARLDINRLMERVDINAIVDRVDLDAVTERMQLADIVSRSAGGILTKMLDVLRRVLVGVDAVIVRGVDRVLGRKGAPTGPAYLVDQPLDADQSGPRVTGTYAGPVSRLVAFFLDVALILVVFAGGAALVSYLLNLVAGIDFARTNAPGWTIAIFVWWFVAYWFGQAVAGRTPAMAFFGLRVVTVDGQTITPGRAAVRTLVLPISVVFLFIGVLLMLVQRERRALHDLVARTAVVYDWGDRPAALPAPLTRWLERRSALGTPPPAADAA